MQVRAGESVDNYEITRFAQLFNDELTLDNLERIQLVNLCRFVGIPPFGTDAFLASRLRAHLARIKVSYLTALPLWTPSAPIPLLAKWPSFVLILQYQS